MYPDLSKLTSQQLLAAAEADEREVRKLEVRRMLRLLEWADRHDGDPRKEPNHVPVKLGGKRLIRLGGPGTPKVQDLPLLEMTIARGESMYTTHATLADGLDLRHRLPEFWKTVQALRVPMWVARKVAKMSRKLTEEQVAVVDAACAAAADQPATTILEIAEAKIIEADPAAHAERIKKAKRKKGVWVTTTKPGDSVDEETGEPGVSTIFARLDEGDMTGLDHMVDQLAHLLADHAAETVDPDTGCELGMGHFRAEALAMLADPKAVLDFLTTATAEEPSEPTAPEPVDAPADTDPDEPTASDPAHPTPTEPTAPVRPVRPVKPVTQPATAQVYVHIDAETLLADTDGVTRVEGLGPRLLSQLQELLGHHQVFLTPVVDLNQGRSTKAYEHPTKVKQRTELRTVGEVFPHSPTRINHTGRSLDHDHPTPFDPNGPPGQTGDHNDAPLTRRHHRAKTHMGYSVLQLGPDEWIWGTPNGLYRLVTLHGTRALTTLEYQLYKDVAITLAKDFPAA